MNIQLIITLLVMLLMIIKGGVTAAKGFCAAGLNWDWWQ